LIFFEKSKNKGKEEKEKEKGRELVNGPISSKNT
jgi:hypothetical protein